MDYNSKKFYAYAKALLSRKYSFKKLHHKQLESESCLQEALKHARIASWELARGSETAVWSGQICQLMGLPADFQPSPDKPYQLINSNDLQAVIASLQHSFATGDEHQLEYRIKRHDNGAERWIECRGKAVLDSYGIPEKLTGFIQDITERKRAENFESFRNYTLELLTTDISLLDILKAIVLGVEQINPAMLCSILLLDDEGKHIVNLVAPSLPDFYNVAIDGIEIGVGVGSCGASAWTGERIIVDDIATHPNWEPYKELAAKAGLAACWSQPIYSLTRKVLGTFAIYHRDLNSPLPSDIYLIEQSARLVSIAIERKDAQKSIDDLSKKLLEKVHRQSDALTKTNLSLVRNLVELHLANQKLAEREASLNAIFNSAAEGIITVDMRDIIISVNGAVETIFGYPSKELIGGDIRKIIKIPPRDAAYFIASSVAENNSETHEIEGLHKNGNVIPLDMSRADYLINNIHHFTKIVRDVSERKLREAKDMGHLHELAHVTRLGMMGEMASGMAHEINQPLAAISTYTQIILNLIKNENIDLVMLAEVAEKAQKQALRAGNIVHLMKGFIQSKKIANSTADINTLIQKSVDLCIHDLKLNNITLALELESNLPPVYVGQIQIEQVIINLIRNSTDALKSCAKEQQHQITIQSCMTLKNEILVRVKDNGNGINAEQKLKILMPFYTTKTEGIGMGLSISRSLIETHKGTFNFNSEPGKGATFYFTIPTIKKWVGE
jgi:PAS domain S-box-containing protein